MRSEQSVKIKLSDFREDELVDQLELAACFGCTDRTIRAMAARGELPPGIRVAGKTRWLAGNVRAWIQDRVQRRENEMRNFLEKVERSI